MTIKVAADVTIRTVRITRTDGQDLKEHEAVSRANAWIREGGQPLTSWEFLDVERRNYDTADVSYRYRHSWDAAEHGEADNE